jgi:hypothetical protein
MSYKQEPESTVRHIPRKIGPRRLLTLVFDMPWMSFAIVKMPSVMMVLEYTDQRAPDDTNFS